MPKKLQYLLVTCIITIVFIISGCTGPIPPDEDEEILRQQVVDRVIAFGQAWESNNADAVISFYTDPHYELKHENGETVIIGPIENAAYHNLLEFFFADWTVLVNQFMEITVIEIDPSQAIVEAIERIVILTEEEELEKITRVRFTFNRVQRVWKIYQYEILEVLL